MATHKKSARTGETGTPTSKEIEEAFTKAPKDVVEKALRELNLLFLPSEGK